MKISRIVILIMVICAIVNSGCKKNQTAGNSYYVKKATWYESMLESVLNAQTKMQLPFEAGHWYSAGPFTCSSDSLFNKPFSPEQNHHLLVPHDDGSIKWQKRIEWEDGVINEISFDQTAVYYIQRIITGAADTSVSFYLGSDDGLKVWMNGTLLLSNNVERGCSPNQDSVKLNIRKGINVLLLRVNNFSGGFAFYASFTRTNPVFELWEKVKADFPSDNDQKEMSWESAHNIWHNFHLSGRLNDLAQRYLDGYYVSCEERGMDCSIINPDVKSRKELFAIRDSFIRSKKAEYIILTPPAPAFPLINGPRVFGVRPGNPFLYTIPVSGERPVEYLAVNLPAGLTLNKNTGIITGVIQKKGTFTVLLKAVNKYGRDSVLFKIIAGDKIALTPPMGWNSWNCFGCAITEAKIKAAADAMVSSGLINYGWSYINIDDCWMKIPDKNDPVISDSTKYADYSKITQRLCKTETLKPYQHGLMGTTRDTNGMILSNKDFPDMPALTRYIHDKGLKAGIYISPGPLTCQCYIGSYMFEDKDAQQFAHWQFDYLKYDWCGYSAVAENRELAELKKPYIKMRQSLDKVKRDIVYSICQYGWGDVWKWGHEVGGNCWRTTGDIVDTWASMASIGFRQAPLAKYSRPGYWNDPDMLVVGWVGWGPSLRPTRLSANEQYTHISLWCLLNSPLLIGCDMTRLDPFTLSLLTNREVLAVNQDELGMQAVQRISNDDFQVWTKELADGSMAVGIFNISAKRKSFTLNWSDLNIKGNRIIRDLWRQTDLLTSASRFDCSVARHGVILIRLIPQMK